MLSSLKNNKHWNEYPFGTIFYEHLVRLFATKNIHPNAYTIAFIGLGVASGVAIHFGHIIISFVLWRLSIILDLADGPIARMKGLESKTGQLLDNLGHIVSGFSLTFFATLYAYESTTIAHLCTTLFVSVYTVKYMIYTLFEARSKNRISKHPTFIFIEKRIADTLDIEILFFLSFLPYWCIYLFIGYKCIKLVALLLIAFRRAKYYG